MRFIAALAVRSRPGNFRGNLEAARPRRRPWLNFPPEYLCILCHDAGLTAFIATPRNARSPTDIDPLLYLSIPGEGSFFLPQFTVSPGSRAAVFHRPGFLGGPLYPPSNPPLQMPDSRKIGPPLYKPLLELSFHSAGPKPWPTWTIGTAADALIVARYDRPAAAPSEYNEITESPAHPEELVFSDVLVIRTGDPARHHGNFHFHGRPAALA